MTSLLFSLLPMILIGLYFFVLRNRKDISWEIKRGLVCPSCKESTDPNTNNMDPFNGKEVILTCVSCKRDESLESVIGNKWKARLAKFRVYLISDKFKKLQLVLMCTLGALVIVDITCIFIGIRGMSVLSNSFNTLYWVLMLIRLRYTTIKKTSVERSL